VAKTKAATRKQIESLVYERVGDQNASTIRTRARAVAGGVVTRRLLGKRELTASSEVRKAPAAKSWDVDAEALKALEARRAPLQSCSSALLTIGPKPSAQSKALIAKVGQSLAVLDTAIDGLSPEAPKTVIVGAPVELNKIPFPEFKSSSAGAR
jgi:hypothetical protein